MMVSCDMNCCQNGHRWYPEACYFVSLSWERRGDDTQRKTLWFESKHTLAASPGMSWTVLCAFQEAVSPCLCIPPLPWLPTMLRTFRKRCTWYQFHLWSVALVWWRMPRGQLCAPLSLVTEKAWPQQSLAQSFARPGQRVSGWHHGGNGQRWSRPCSLTAWVPWVISVLTCTPLLPLLTSPLPPPSLLTPTPEVPSWTH